MAIDPRIRDRRVAVRRAEGRRRLRFLAVCLGMVGLAVAAWGLTRSPLLDLDHVRYEGVAGPDAEAVENAAGLGTGMAMFDLDLGAVERDITALPWVASATASRDWPGTVRVEVETRQPVAVLGITPGPAMLVDAEGVIVRMAPDDVDLPRIAMAPTVEPGETETAALPAVAVAISVPDDLLPWIDAITLDDSMLGLDLIGSARVHLGGADFVADKLAAVRSLLDGVDLTCLDLIDVAVADLPTVTRDAACESGTTEGTTDDA